MKNTIHTPGSARLKTVRAFLFAGTIALGTATLAHGANIAYTWTGTSSADWDDLANWSGTGKPADNEDGIFSEDAGNISTVTIQNGTFLPTVNVPTYANQGGGKRTPQFVIEPGAALDIRGNALTYDGGTTGSTRTIATVGVGATLTMGSDSGANFIPARDGDATHGFNINGTYNIVTNRLDYGFNDNRLSVWTLDGGTVNLLNASNGSNWVSMFGSRSGSATATNTVTLNNASTWNGGYWQGNITNDTVLFDLQDVGSKLTFSAAGGLVTSVAVAESYEGKLWTSSTLGDENLQYDVTNNLLTITVIPEPSSLSLAALGALGLALRGRRRSR